MRISDWSSDVCSSDLLGATPPIAPALDAIIERFGTDAVAEVTGRTRRLIRLPDGGQKLQSRSPSACMADADAFMNGAKRILVFSSSEERRVGTECVSTCRSRL